MTHGFAHVPCPECDSLGTVGGVECVRCKGNGSIPDPRLRELAVAHARRDTDICLTDCDHDNCREWVDDLMLLVDDVADFVAGKV